MELSFLKMSSIEDYQGFGRINAKVSNVRQVDKGTAVGYPDRGLVQQRYCCKQGTLLSSAAAHYQLQFRQDKHHWAFVCYLLLLYLYSSAVGGGHSNEFPACSNTRSLCVTFSDSFHLLTIIF